MKIVMSAFPGTGKSEIFKRALELGLKPAFVQFDDHTLEYELHIAKAPGIPVFDSDSSKFDKAAFPGNYIKHIQNVLNTCDNVVILVSSHDNVREAMREAGIDYHLCYPQIELKADYIERYKERGSPEAFVNMMEEKWVDFIGSCEADPTTHKCILSEGEYLVDYLKPLLNKERYPTAVVNGTESIGDVVTDAEGNPVAVYGANGLEELPPAPSEDDQPTDETPRYENVEASLVMGDDIEVLENVVAVCQTEARDGMEGYEDNGVVFVTAVADIKERYGVDVEPTLAGMEGFLDSLKNAFAKLGEKLKGQPKKEHLAQIQRYLFEASKAVKQYGSDKWLDGQQFINVGKTKIQVPAAFKDVTDPDGIDKIIDIFIKTLDKQHQAYYANALARQKAGMPIFNKFAKKAESDDGAAELAKSLPIKPDPLPGIKQADLSGLLNISMEKGELPVLNKDKVKDVVKTLTRILEVVDGWEEKREKLFNGPSYEDFYDSDFFDAIIDTKECEELIRAVEWESATSDIEEIGYFYNKTMLPVCKFLEMWILQSVK